MPVRPRRRRPRPAGPGRRAARSSQRRGPAQPGAALRSAFDAGLAAAAAGAGLEVAQPGPGTALVDPAAVVDDLDHDVVGDVESDGEVCGAGVAGGVADAFADDGLDVG